jgi:hypothetical protein
MRGKFCSRLLLLTCALALSGCAQNVKPPSANGGMFRQKNEGYSILYKLMSQESDVAKIFIIKHASDQVGNVVKQVAATCQAAKAQMDEFPKKDNRIEYDVSDLPYMEQSSRDLAQKADTTALLGHSGKDFELELVFTQAQAMMYAHDLCDALASNEDDPLRKTFLTDLSKQTGRLMDSLMELLEVKS